MTDEETEAAKKLVEYSFNNKLYKENGLNYLYTLSDSFSSQRGFWMNSDYTNNDRWKAYINAGNYVRNVLIPIHKQTIENADTTAD